MIKKLKARATAAVAATALMIGVVLVTAAPASATDYSINMDNACAYFTNVGWAWAQPADPSNPYTWHCSTAPRPFWVQWGGNIDLVTWCAYVQPGSSPVLVSPGNAYSWRCRT